MAASEQVEKLTATHVPYQFHIRCITQTVSQNMEKPQRLCALCALCLPI